MYRQWNTRTQIRVSGSVNGSEDRLSIVFLLQGSAYFAVVRDDYIFPSLQCAAVCVHVARDTSLTVQPAHLQCTSTAMQRDIRLPLDKQM